MAGLGEVHPAIQGIIKKRMELLEEKLTQALAVYSALQKENFKALMEKALSW